MTKREPTITEVAPPRHPLMPASTPDFLTQAWVDCLRWASGFEPILRQFSDETGIVVVAPKSPLDRMIDEATGADRATFEAFVAWFNENVWGNEDEMEAAP